jgi:4-hydroxybenzoyl-CoA reductase subunit beta
MELPPFQYHRPGSAEEAAALLARHGDDVDVLAGGTDLLPNYKNRLNPKGHVVSLSAIASMKELSPTRIGAGVRLVELERSELVARTFPVIGETAAAISSPPLREHGTVGGNVMLDTRCFFFNQAPMWRESRNFCLKAEGGSCLVVPASNDHCYATYSGELAAAFLVLDGRAELLSAGGRREVPLTAFFENEGIRRFADRRPGELLTAIVLPHDAPAWTAGYQKLRIRDSIDFPSLGVAVALRMDGDVVAGLRVATTALASCPERLDEVCAPFLGRTADASLAEELGEAAVKASTAYRNVPLDPKYRRKMVGVFVRRLLARLDDRFAP